jgi:hypothetical protein
VLGSILKDASLRWTDFKAAEIEIGHLRQIDPVPCNEWRS